MSHTQPPAQPPAQPSAQPSALGVIRPVGPPTKHQLAVMIWIAVFPTLTVLNLTIGPYLKDTDPVLRTFVLATIAVPIVIYGLMPRLHRIRGRIISRRTRA